MNRFLTVRRLGLWFSTAVLQPAPARAALAGMLGVLSTAFLCGCPGGNPVADPGESVWIVAPEGVVYECAIDGESIGEVSDTGLEVSVEPGFHTLSWNEGSELREVSIRLPVTERLLRVLRTLDPSFRLDVYSVDYGTESGIQYGTSSDMKSFLVSRGQRFEANIVDRLAYADVSASLTCKIGSPQTFEVNADVYISSEVRPDAPLFITEEGDRIMAEQ